jgi:hypothetical protein
MMFSVCVAACTFLLCCASLIAAESTAIAVFMDFETEPSAEALSQMKNEIAEIMKPSGIRFDWRMMRDRRAGDSFRDLVVVSFKGSCQADHPVLYNELGPVVEKQPLAFTRISDGQVLPFSDVECDTIRRFIGPVVASASPQNRNGILGRALGRVVAHEMYHMFARTTAHAQEGVARSFHTRKELTAREFHFTEHESQMLRDIKWKELLLSGEGQFPDTAGLGR